MVSENSHTEISSRHARSACMFVKIRGYKFSCTFTVYKEWLDFYGDSPYCGSNVQGSSFYGLSLVLLNCINTLAV